MPYFIKDSNPLQPLNFLRPAERVPTAGSEAYRTGTHSSGYLEASKVNLSVPEGVPYASPPLFSHTLLRLLRPGFSP